MDGNEAAGLAREAEARELPFVFTGTAREYFGIWIVNLLLSIVTLGIWSAWAKVRRERWFLGHTLVDGSPFEYHARGGQILVGRLFIVLLSASYVAAALYDPNWAWVPFVVALPLSPLLINQGIRFVARVTGWRGARFDFEGSYLATLGYFTLLPVAYFFTLGLTLPIGTRQTMRYLAGRLSFGGQRFAADPSLRRLYGILGLTYLVGLLLLIPFAASIAGVIYYVATHAPPEGGQVEPPFILRAVLIASTLLLNFGVYCFYSVKTTNLVIGSLTLDGRHRFRSTVSPWRYLWIVASGWAATIATLGLLRPWAAVREWRYIARCRSMVQVGPLSGFDTGVPGSGKGFFAELGIFSGIGFGF